MFLTVREESFTISCWRKYGRLHRYRPLYGTVRMSTVRFTEKCQYLRVYVVNCAAAQGDCVRRG